MPDLASLVALLQLAVKNRTQLALENIALRHQLSAHKRSLGRPNIKDGDRIFWLTVMRMLKESRSARRMLKRAPCKTLATDHGTGAKTTASVTASKMRSQSTRMIRVHGTSSAWR